MTVVGMCKVDAVGDNSISGSVFNKMLTFFFSAPVFVMEQINANQMYFNKEY